MTPRDRYVAALTFGNPDRVPFEPGYPRESTLAIWHQQGMPRDKHYYTALLDELGIAPERTKPHIDVGVSFRMIPEFE